MRSKLQLVYQISSGCVAILDRVRELMVIVRKQVSVGIEEHIEDITANFEEELKGCAVVRESLNCRRVRIKC
jgi:hypothetical protein